MKYIALFLFFSTPAMAITCPPPSLLDGFSGYLSGSIVNGYQYSTSQAFLYVNLTTGLYTGFLFVPQFTLRQFTNSSNPDNFYNTQISTPLGEPPAFHETMMTELCGNLLNENGNYLLTR